MSFRAFDPFTTALEQSSAALGMRDQLGRREEAARLVRFYEGNQRPYLEQYLTALFKEPTLRARYIQLASFSNVTRWVIDHVTALGQEPIQVTWANEADQKLWDKVAYQETDFDLFVTAWARYTELCKTVVALASWDDDELCIRLDFFTPNVIDVGYSEPDEMHPTCPDLYRVLENEAAQGEQWQVWDFSGDVPMMFDATRDSVASEGEPWEVVDPLTGKPLVPFIPLRTNHPQRAYFIDDGQPELIDAQEFVNRQWTQVGYTMHYGSFQVPILKGNNWGDRNGKKLNLTYDPSEGIVCPSDPTGAQQPDIRWDGPANMEAIERTLQVIEAKRRELAQTFHFDASSVTSSAEVASGVSLWIRNQALRQKMKLTRTLAQKPLSHLVWAMACIHNHFAPPGERRFDLSARPTIEIPDPSFQMDPETELAIDEKKLSLGIISREDLIRKWRPEIDETELAALLAAKAPAPPTQAGGISALFRKAAPPMMNPNAPVAPETNQPAPAEPARK